MAKKGTSIKLEVTGDKSYGRDSWYGYGPFKAKVNDDETLTVGLPDMEPQICTPASNEYGTYYIVNMMGGKAFASVVDHEKYGKYLRIKLGDKVELPAAVVEKINYKPKPAAGKRGAENKNYW